MFDLRPAQKADLDAIVDLWHNGWHEAHRTLVPVGLRAYRTPRHFRLWLRECEDEFHVASKAGDIIGFTSIKGSEVVKLYVASASRGGGVASLLLAHAENILRRRAVSTALLFCTAGNVRAERFYAKHGWGLVRTFDDRLWLPRDTPGAFIVSTRQYSKDLLVGASQVT